MKLQQLIVLLPCQSLESLSLERSGDEADQILASWTAMFHPGLLASTGDLPGWHRAEDPPQEVTDSLIVIPHCCEELLPEGWLAHAQNVAARVIRGLQDRQRIVALALELLEGVCDSLSPELVADFFAAGFGQIQVELLTRQLRYMSNLDTESFRRRMVAAAQHAVDGDEASAREELHSAFDLLTEAREYYYPVETYLLDLTLVAPTTIDQSLRAELTAEGPTNLLICGAVLEQMAREDPACLAILKAAVEKGTVSIIGGEYEEQELPLLAVEGILDELRRGQAAYDSHLGQHPTVFGRRRFGLWPVLPQILQQLGFVGALHFSLDDGRFPTGNQSKIRWEGMDGTAVEALARVPINASLSEAFLSLPRRLGDTMDLDHASTLVFAHWPDRVCTWYRDLRRLLRFSPVLGRFVSVGDYFERTQLVGNQTRPKADEYRPPYLRQAVAKEQPDPISRWVRYYARRAVLDTLTAVTFLADLIGGLSVPGSELDDLARQVDLARNNELDLPRNNELHGNPTLDARLAAALGRAIGRFAAVLPRTESPAETGLLLVNPFSFSRQVLAETAELEQLPALTGPVRAGHVSPSGSQLIVDVPAMGFAWLGRSGETPPPPAPRKRTKKREEPALAEENLLRNEFFELVICPKTGAIQGIHEYQLRGNRLGQQVAMRLVPPANSRCEVWDEQALAEEYSKMVADEVSVTCAGPLVGEIASRGRLLDWDGNRVAAFRQRTRVRRGSRVVEIQLDLDIDRLPKPDPWNSYYAVRFAWPDETTQLCRSVNWACLPTDNRLLEAPHFIDLRSAKSRVTILTGGLPYHRRFGMRMLDTLLVVHGESRRSFRLGVAIGLGHPIQGALDFLAPKAMIAQNAPPPCSQYGWLFHVDARNVVATHWSPLLLGEQVVGYRTRLLEVEGRNTRVGIRSFRPVKAARKTDLRGADPKPLPAEDDRVTIDLPAYGWVQVEADFCG